MICIHDNTLRDGSETHRNKSKYHQSKMTGFGEEIGGIGTDPVVISFALALEER